MNSGRDQNTEQAPAIDDELRPYLASVTESEANEHLQRLLEKAQPIVYRIARSMRAGVGVGKPTHDFNTQDIFGDVSLRLLQSLRALKSNPSRHPISNYAGLVATTTSSVFSDLLRLQDRQRRNLYEKVRHLFRVNTSLAIWKDAEGKTVCGYESWRPRTKTAPAGDASSQLRFEFESQVGSKRKRNTAELILLVLDNIGHPITLDELVDLINVAAEGVQIQTISIDDKHYVQASQLVTFQPDIIAGRENQLLLHRLFGEIQKLRIEQRKSLLLNMTDSYGFGIEWFIFTEIATEERLAQLLEVTIDQFRKLLNELPMSDSDIASQLGISQAKVMNIRRAVRERLERQRRAFFGETSDSKRMK